MDVVTLTATTGRPLTGPSPSRSNPFARAPSLPAGSISFSKSSLLPSLASPAKTPGLPKRINPFATPAVVNVAAAETGVGSASSKGRSGWRLLWRGGLEIGQQGYRLEGATFFAQLQFPSTPGETGFNPFDVPVTGTPGAAALPSPLTMRNSDTDICLSLESMRGRKYLQVRGVVDLPIDEVLDGESINGEASPGAQVQMSIAPTSLLLITYFTNNLCRDKKLSPTGRTRRAIELGLGDDTSPSNTLLIYGQAQEGEAGDTSRSIRLTVGRRKPPPSAQPGKVRPGEPLPRAPLFFPSKAPVKAPPPFPNRDALSKSRSFQRATSVNSIYAPPPPAPPIPVPKASLESGSGRTPGRRGEKRKRDVGKEEDRMRRAGKIVPSRLQQIDVVDGSTDAEDTALFEPIGDNINDNEEEDIFGTKAPMTNGVITADEGSSRKRGKVPQQVLDNKAVIRKQTLVLLESRGYARQHELFKDIFAMVTKGVYFVCRDAMPHIPIKTDVVQHFITRHLDMYLPSSINDTLLGLPLEVPEPEYVDATSEGDIVKLEDLEEAANIPASDDMGIPHRRRTMDSVIEEDEEDQ